MHSSSTLTAQSFKTFADYTDMKDLLGKVHSSKSSQALRPYLVKEKVKSREDNPMYTDHWYLLLRRGLFGAQVEKAMAEIDLYFLGYSTDIEIIKEGENYYVASREIKAFTEWAYCSNKVTTLADGTLALANKKSHTIIKGMGTVFTLADFFGISDPHEHNFGIQENEKECLIFQIDKEHSFDFKEKDEEGYHNFETELSNGMFSGLKASLAETAWFKQEKQALLRKIAETDFSIIENILRKNITSNQLESSRWLRNYMLKFGTDYEKKTFSDPKVSRQFDEADESQHGVESIIQKLRKKHENLRKELNITAITTQTKVSYLPSAANFFKSTSSIKDFKHQSDEPEVLVRIDATTEADIITVSLSLTSR